MSDLSMRAGRCVSLPSTLFLLAILLSGLVCRLVLPSDAAAAQDTPAALRAAMPVYSESHALLIGASRYQRGWLPLEGVQEDITALRTALERHGFRVQVLTDPTSEQLIAGFSDFIQQHGMAPQNRLLFYFAGHGDTLPQVYGGDVGYIVPIDAPMPKTDRAGFLARAMDMNQIDVYARRIQSLHALFVFDACFSGSIFTLQKGAVAGSIGTKTSLPVRQFITSGSAAERVSDRSLFRHLLIQGIEGEGDLNGDRYVTGEELGMFVQKQIITYTHDRQHPQYGTLGDPQLDRGDFVFTVSPARVEPTPSPRLPTSTPRGWITLNAFPQAVIWVDGRRIDAFPVRELSLPAGMHHIKFTRDAEPPLEQDVEVVAEQKLFCIGEFDRKEIRCKSRNRR